MKPEQTQAKNAEPKKPSLTRNLTYEGIQAQLQQDRARHLASIPEFEVIEVNLPKRDPKTNEVIKDSMGFTELVKKSMLRREYEDIKWSERIAQFA